MTGFISKCAMANSRHYSNTDNPVDFPSGTPTLKSNAMASTVSHAEDCLYGILEDIKDYGTPEQREAIYNSLESLETLYFLLREEE